MRTKIKNPMIAAQVVEILAEKGVSSVVEGDEVVVAQNVQRALDTFPFRDWFKNQHEDCDCATCLPPTY